MCAGFWSYKWINALHVQNMLNAVQLIVWYCVVRKVDFKKKLLFFTFFVCFICSFSGFRLRAYLCPTMLLQQSIRGWYALHISKATMQWIIFVSQLLVSGVWTILYSHTQLHKTQIIFSLLLISLYKFIWILDGNFTWTTALMPPIDSKE